MKMIEKAERELSNKLNDVVWLVKIGNIYKVQRIENGDFDRYDYLNFGKLSEVFEYCAGY